MDKKLCKMAMITILGVIGNFIIQVNGLKPEIQHSFREPEKRPPMIVTTFFTLLVAFPALILLTLWSKTVSLKFDTLTLRRIIFHIILLMILVCYAKFWLGTNMFDTMRYAAPLTCLLFHVFT